MAAVGSAHASSIKYALSGTLDSGSFSGYVTFDTATQSFTGGDILALDVTAMENFTQFIASGQFSTGTYDFLNDTVSGKQFSLGISTATLANGATSGVLCSSASVCGSYISGINTTQNNALTGTFAVTPEPAPLLLLATGVLGLVALRRRQVLSL